MCDINTRFNIKTFLANILIKKQSAADNRSVDGDSVGRRLDMVSDMVQEISRIDKQLSDDGSLFKSDNIEKLTNEVAHLQQEIESNNKLLSEKDCTIASLIECGILKDRELNDLRNRNCSIERNSYTSGNDSAVSGSYYLKMYRAAVAQINVCFSHALQSFATLSSCNPTFTHGFLASVRKS